MPFCENCGTTVKETANFCKSCGFNLNIAESAESDFHEQEEANTLDKIQKENIEAAERVWNNLSWEENEEEVTNEVDEQHNKKLDKKVRRASTIFAILIFLVIGSVLSSKENPDISRHKKQILYDCWNVKDKNGKMITENVAISGRYMMLMNELQDDAKLKKAYKDFYAFSLLMIDDKLVSFGLWDRVVVTDKAKKYYGEGFNTNQ